MANVTLSIDDVLLRRARVRAAEQGTSVNAVIRRELERYAASSSKEEAVKSFLELAAANPGSSDGAKWNREDLYLERFKGKWE